MSGRGDMEMGHFTLARLDGAGAMRSSADPDVLARAVRAHKLGDAVAQAALTFALMFAIGAVAFVLSAEHAAAASQLIVNSVIDNSAVLLTLATTGAALLIARRASVRLAQARIARRSATRPDSTGSHGTQARPR